MIVRFDTEEEAKERFETLKEKHNGIMVTSSMFCFYISEIDNNHLLHGITMFYTLRDENIEVTCHADLICNLLTARKIVDMIQEVRK